MEFQKLETDELMIRPLSSEDVPAIFQLSREKSLGDWIPDQVYKDENEAAEVIEFLKSQYGPSPDPSQRPFVLGVALKRTGEVIGHVGLSPLSDGEVEIGYAIGEAMTLDQAVTAIFAAVAEYRRSKFDVGWATRNTETPAPITIAQGPPNSDRREYFAAHGSAPSPQQAQAINLIHRSSRSSDPNRILSDRRTAESP
jgi:hypothetical protein